MNQYERRVLGKELIANNRKLLASVGCTQAQVDSLCDRHFSALPKWVRNRLKRSAYGSGQNAPIKLDPRNGERAFYVDKSVLPRHKEAKA